MPHKIVILGAAESGVGAALLAQQQGYEVFVSDSGEIKEALQQELEQHHIPFEQGSHSWEKISGADERVKSPGIPE